MFMDEKLPAIGQVLESQSEISGLGAEDAVNLLQTGCFGLWLGKTMGRKEEQTDKDEKSRWKTHKQESFL